MEMGYNSERTDERTSNYVQTAIPKLAILLYTYDIADCVLTTHPVRVRRSIDTMASNYLANADGKLD